MTNIDKELVDAADRVLRSVCIDILTTTPGEYSVIDTFALDPENVKIDPLSLLDNLIHPSEPATWLSPVVDSNGKITDVVEYIRDDDEFGAASVSMSLNRSPAVDSTSIRGSSSNVPFYPGGFDSAFGNVMAFARDEDNQESDEKEFFREEALLTCAPGMPGGLSFSKPKQTSTEAAKPDNTPTVDGNIDFDSTDLFELMDFVGGGSPLVIPTESSGPEVQIDSAPKAEVIPDGTDSSVTEEIEEALVTPLPKPALKFVPPERFAYAKQLDPASCEAEYRALVPNMAKKVDFRVFISYGMG
ncbi:unnamed protein product [Cylicostephanus goldi]|uniref:Ski2 N-terminal domain-containing protein n=1 Tax=Cylicostephanus goldi TaxID=71465 RepID=A0A3P6SEV9_CYLGO|nr:unnamed protein product [Cylicostephanus goldi]